ncbi:MAG: Chemotaxis response regulator protein-glutamate methylesterase [Phycisphaerae bacterium]|nr:Chemotaxis response regulator protein-glutamate methylesterase [Phycisphaerae bacterium]
MLPDVDAAAPTLLPVLPTIHAAGLPHGAAESGADAGAAVAPRHRVMLVDDEAGVLAALKRLLRREPYDITTASSAAEALQLIESGPPDLIISDQRMPGSTGLDLLRTVRTRWPGTIRIILSGYAEVGSIIAAVNEGAIYKFLTKPWNDEELKINIRRALEQSELERENRRMTQAIAAQNAQLTELNELLGRRAADATIGLLATQEFFDRMPVGLLVVDDGELVVAANGEARRLLAHHCRGLIGLEARAALPLDLVGMLDAGAGEPAASGRCQLAGRAVQWRAQRMQRGDETRAIAWLLWEDLA